MKIKVLEFVEGAKQAEGITVIIDVFRAFSIACFILENGAEKIIPVGDIDSAYKYKEENPRYVLIGERNGIIQEGFEHGNSPFEIQDVDFTGKTVVQTTSNGTQGIVNATSATEILTGAFVNAVATAEYIKKKNPEVVSLVAMGSNNRSRDEDLLCAEYIKNAVSGSKQLDFQKDVFDHLKTYKGVERFFDPDKKWAPEEDFGLCLTLNRFNFALKVDYDEAKQPFFNIV